MLSYFQAVILGIIQGATELFPVSSLGHSVIAPGLFHWTVNQSDPFFLAFLVATHLATALVLVGFFYKDWMLIILCWFKALFRRGPKTEGGAPVSAGSIVNMYARLGWLILIATIPAGLLGFLFQKKLAILFASPRIVALFLLLNGVMLWAMEIYQKRRAAVEDIGSADSDSRISRLSVGKSIGIGLAQCLALLPGFSRTGATLSGGLLAGMNHEDSARFAFLLATPIILAAAVLKLPELFVSGKAALLGPLLAGVVAAGVGAYLSVRFLTKYFKTHKLTPFGLYCIVVALAYLVLV